MKQYWKLLAIGLLLFLGIVTVQAANLPEQWIVDPQSNLPSSTCAQLEHLLSETANKQGVYIRVFILNTPPIGTFQEQVLEAISIWEAKNPYIHSGLKFGYIGINTHIMEGKIFLGAKSVYFPFLKEGLQNLETLGIGAALLEGDIEKAIFQGVIGLSTLLKEPPTVEPRGLFEWLIELYNTSFAFHLFVIIVFLGLIGGGIVIYLRDPKTHS
jgi:hypothetical protein